jgi:malonyl CoA-acyl carrier protein transacylase
MSLAFVFPGQGSQKKGMGEGLFQRFPDLVRAADAQLGYSIQELCLSDPENKLGQTQFTQPALYTVNALTFLAKIEDEKRRPDWLAGHSLGEYDALVAADAFDFLTGLKLVQKRGALMAQCSGGGMAAVMGITADRISELIYNFAFDSIDVANLNSPNQTVISGPAADVTAGSVILKEAGAKVIPLNVSGAFHSRMMEPAAAEFASFLSGFSFRPLKIPVIANATALPYENGKVAELLAKQITSSVRWTESIRYITRQGSPEFVEVGPGAVLTGLIRQIMKDVSSAPSPAAA